MTNSTRLEAALVAEIRRQSLALDNLQDLSSVGFTVYLNGNCEEVHLRPETKAKGDRRLTRPIGQT